MEKVKVKNSFFETFRMNQGIINGILTKDFPVKTGYWIGRSIDKLNSESKVYFDQKDKIINKYSSKGEDGKPETDENGNLKFENFEEFSKSLIELQQIEIELDVNFVEVDLDELEKKNITLKPLEVMLMPFLVPKESL